ncbi:hypothetical protein [Ktedonospora formicarum]|uniref:Uncharacterized protein n=1 Tax=Ktedonospora formicarum TaxID=2778364 RepID=A0A8J3HVH9_9CHLR|nr:hypothetical protein [Ktedonospora formicarum]GHO44534.1 hypothetical protein KSX_26970 [Ktedonospora formicarum]
MRAFEIITEAEKLGSRKATHNTIHNALIVASRRVNDPHLTPKEREKARKVENVLLGYLKKHA